MATASGSIRVQFVREKITKNTVRYSEVSTEYIGFVYIRKETFNGAEFPERLNIVLEFEA